MAKHNIFLCSPHVDGCACTTREEFVCNPYCVLNYCPSDGEGEDCLANPVRLVRVKAGAGFTLAVKD